MDSLVLPADGRLQRIEAAAGGVTVRGVVRSGTRLARILEIDGPAGRAAPALAGFVGRAAAQGCTVTRAEVAADDPSEAAFRAAGFREIAPAVHACQPARPVARFEFRTEPAAPRIHPYYAQTTGFTCGAVALMLAHRRFDPTAPVDRRTEIAIWRSATTVHAARGPGGCDPFGVACAAAQMGLQAQVVASIEGPFLIGKAYSDSQRDLMAFVQSGFRDEARERGIAVEIRDWTADDLSRTLAAGGAAIVLIDQTLFLGEAIPHWVLVHRLIPESSHGPTYMVDDPWVEPDDRETDTDRYDLPVPDEALDRMAWWGEQPYRAVVLLNAPPSNRPRPAGATDLVDRMRAPVRP